MLGRLIPMSNKLFALVGPYASGKSSLITRLMDLGVHYIPVYSTSDAMRLKKTSAWLILSASLLLSRLTGL